VTIVVFPAAGRKICMDDIGKLRFYDLAGKGIRKLTQLWFAHRIHSHKKFKVKIMFAVF
jgi:hypothetical protein